MASPDGGWAAAYGVGGGGGQPAHTPVAVSAPYWYGQGGAGDPNLHAAATNPGGGGGGPPPTSPPPAGSVNVPWDYAALIKQDPNYIAWQNSSAMNLGNAASTRKAAIQALVEQYGGLPAGFTDTYGDLAPGDLAAAAANPESATAQLGQQYKTNLKNLQSGLAARGALHSGDLGYGTTQLDNANAADLYNLGTNFGSQLSQAVSGYTGALSTDNTSMNTAIGQAYGDLLQNPAYGTPQSATLVTNWQSQYGVPVYQDGSGNLYKLDANGTPVPFGG